MRYSIDTSALIDARRRLYPPDAFPTLWERIEELIYRGELIASDEVLVELGGSDDELLAWARAHSPMFIPVDDGIQEVVSRIMSGPQRDLVDVERSRSQADPFVIAVGITHGATVVTSERRAGPGGRPRIPNVCDAEDVRCLSLLEMIRELGWTF